MILDMATVNQDVATFNSVNNTCSRFRSIIKEGKKRILPAHIPCVYDESSKTRRQSINKLSRHFGPGSGAIESVRKIMGSKNFKTAWLLIEKEKYS